MEIRELTSRKLLNSNLIFLEMFERFSESTEYNRFHGKFVPKLYSNWLIPRTPCKIFG